MTTQPSAVLERAASLYMAGQSLRLTASSLGVSEGTVRRWLARAGVPRRPASFGAPTEHRTPSSQVPMPTGYRRCSRCRKVLPLERFGPALTTTSYYCQPCRRIYRAARSDKDAASRRRWEERHPERSLIKRRAGMCVARAIQSGKLIRPMACDECGATGIRIDAAHSDYSRPLDVRWLCKPCHVQWDHDAPKTVAARAGKGGME